MPAFYRASLAQFLADDSERILGLLVAGSAGLGFAELKQKQTKAWQKQIAALKTAGAALAELWRWELLPASLADGPRSRSTQRSTDSIPPSSSSGHRFPFDSTDKKLHEPYP
jgi:hypothetical protein